LKNLGGADVRLVRRKTESDFKTAKLFGKIAARFRSPRNALPRSGRLIPMGCPLSGVAAMKEIIDSMGATYGPEALKVIGKAFDDAWAEIGPGFSKNGLQAQSARMTLANAILEEATETAAMPMN
jgi:hypothetical protein